MNWLSLVPQNSISLEPFFKNRDVGEIEILNSGARSSSSLRSILALAICHKSNKVWSGSQDTPISCEEGSAYHQLLFWRHLPTNRGYCFNSPRPETPSRRLPTSRLRVASNGRALHRSVRPTPAPYSCHGSAGNPLLFTSWHYLHFHILSFPFYDYLRKHNDPLDIYWISVGYHVSKRWPIDIDLINIACFLGSRLNRRSSDSGVFGMGQSDHPYCSAFSYGHLPYCVLCHG